MARFKYQSVTLDEIQDEMSRSELQGYIQEGFDFLAQFHGDTDFVNRMDAAYENLAHDTVSLIEMACDFCEYIHTPQNQR